MKNILILLFTLISVFTFAQNDPANAHEYRVVAKTDSTIISGVGQIRYDGVDGKLRFGNGTAWQSYWPTTTSFIYNGATTTLSGATTINGDDLIFGINLTDNFVGTAEYKVTLNDQLIDEVTNFGVRVGAGFVVENNSTTDMTLEITEGRVVMTSLISNNTSTTDLIINKTTEITPAPGLGSQIDIQIEGSNNVQVEALAIAGGETALLLHADELRIPDEPINNDTVNQILVREYGSTGSIRYRNASTFSSVDYVQAIYDSVLNSTSASTAGATITIDLNDQRQRMFVGSASFSTAKTIAFSNDGNALVFDVFFEVTNVAAVLTMPASVIMADVNFDGDDWTPPSTGKYEMGGTWDGTNWWVKIMGPFQ